MLEMLHRSSGPGASWHLGYLLVTGRSRLTGHSDPSWSLGGHVLLFWLLDAPVCGCQAPSNLFGAILAIWRQPWLSVS